MIADEHRYGLLPVVRRFWGIPGERVVAPYTTKYKWGYLYEVLEIDGAHASKFSFKPSVSKAISADFLREISELDKWSLPIVIWDGAGFHPKDLSAEVPSNVRL